MRWARCNRWACFLLLNQPASPLQMNGTLRVSSKGETFNDWTYVLFFTGKTKCIESNNRRTA